jgi:putative DNA primase/helicase
VETNIIRDRIMEFLEGSRKLDADRSKFNPRPRHVTEVFEVLKGGIGLPAKCQPPMWLDTGENASEVLAFRNGLVDVWTGERIASAPRLWTHGAVGYDWNPAAKCPRWLEFLDEVFPKDPESQACIEEQLGYGMTTDMSIQKGALWIGRPRSGKGTIAWVQEQLVGSASYVALSFHDWVSHPNAREDLVGKRVGCFPDVRLKPPKQYGQVLDPGGMDHKSVQLLLQILGGDSITIGRKNIGSWRGRLLMKLILISNGVPNFNDPVLATRFVKVMFGVSFLGREDPNLKDKLARELPGIAARCVAAYRRLRARGFFEQPKSAGVLDRQVAEAGDPFAAFVHEHYVPDPAGFVEAYNMWLALLSWCERESRPDVLRSVPRQHLLRHVKAIPGFGEAKKHRPRLGENGQIRQIRGYLGLRARTREERAAVEDDE